MQSAESDTESQIHLKQTDTGIDLFSIEAAEEVSCPFQAAQILKWKHANTDFFAQRIVIKQGLNFISLEIRLEGPIPLKINFGQDLMVLGYVKSGWAKSNQSGNELEKLEPGQWFHYSNSNFCIDRTSPSAVSIDLFLCTRTLLNRLLQLGSDEIYTALKCFTSGSGNVPFNSGPMSAATFEIAQKISNSNRNGLRYRLQLEANALSWMAEALSLSQLARKKNDRSLSAYDRDAIEKIMQQIKEDPGREYSISELSSIGGINQHKLKSAFKTIYQQTAFSLLRQVRMDHAAQLLKSDRLSVIEVANEVGYSNASHFARAFKERHSLLPKAYQCLYRLT